MNAAKLTGKIYEAGFTKKSFAEGIGIMPSTLSKKLSGDSDITVKEAEKMCELLKIVDPREKVDIFLR